MVRAYASVMAAAGVDIFKVSRYMGHSSAAVTDSTYAHLFRDAAAADMDKLDAFVGIRLTSGRAT